MTGSKNNSNLKSQISNIKKSAWQKKDQSGQILLIIVMLLATVLTVILSVSFKSATDTQVTKLEEESQKALAATEAGIEAALQKQSGSVDIASLAGLGSAGFTGSATIDTATSNQFVTPLLRNNEQYTFYLADPDMNNPSNAPVTIYYGTSSQCNQIALEIALIYDVSPYKIYRWKADTGNLFNSTTDNIGNASGVVIQGVSFNCTTSEISFTSLSNPRLLIVRTFSPSNYATRLAFTSSTNLKLQGKTINSEARSSTGVTKKVTLFQSYPQIPSEFFVTSF